MRVSAHERAGIGPDLGRCCSHVRLQAEAFKLLGSFVVGQGHRESMLGYPSFRKLEC